MNHLGDTNKMVDTPRTDNLLTAILDSDGFVHNGNCPQRWVNYARELERELNAANERIKRLEEAGDEFSEILSSKTPKANCLCHIAPPCSDCVEHWGSREALVNWRKAKEAKP